MPASLKIRLRRGLASLWSSTNPVLDEGELGFLTDGRRLKIGDGSSAWSALPFITSDLPDATVSAPSGTLATWTNSNVTAAGGTYTAPTPATTVSSPPLRFAITNRSTAPITLSYSDPNGVTTVWSVLVGEVCIFRQASTSGYICESGSKPLARLDERYLSDLSIATISANGNAVLGTWYLADPSSAGFTITLPAAPYDNAIVLVENVASTNVVTVSRGGSNDTIEGVTTLVIQPNVYVELTYRASSSQWRMRRFTWEPTPGTNVRRDSNGRVQGVTPVNNSDYSTKAYVDSGRTAGITARSGTYQFPTSVSAFGTQTAAVTGKACFFALDIGPYPDSFDALLVNVGTAQSGGTGTILKGAVYLDDGSGGQPLLTAAGKLVEITFVVTSTGSKLVTLGSVLTLQPGRYWLCGFYYQGSSAPTTAPLLTGASGGASMWSASFSYARYLSVTGLTDLPVGLQAIGSLPDANGILLALRAT